MGTLQRIEQRLESWVSGAFGRLFRSTVTPVDIAAALQHEMDGQAQVVSRDRSLAPNTFTVALAAKDHERLAPYSSSLISEVTALVKEHADLQRYSLPGPLQVGVVQDDALRTGQLRISSAVVAAVATTGAPGLADERSAPAYLDVNGSIVAITAAGVMVGRGSDCDVRIDDPGVSRRHAEFRVLGEGRDADVVVVDLHSTNGTLVDGTRVAQAPVHDGTQVLIGSTTISVYRHDPRHRSG